MEINYKQLLIKYIRFVDDVEGADFISESDLRAFGMTDIEIDELLRIKEDGRKKSL